MRRSGVCVVAVSFGLLGLTTRCVGDSPSNTPDSSAADTAPQADVATESAAQDAGHCDLTKPFGAPVLLPGVVNTTDDDGAFRLTADGTIAAFGRQYKADASAPGQIFLASRPNASAPFGSGTLSEVNDAYGGASPSLSGDGLDIYFTSERPNGQGATGLKIWTAHRSSTQALFGTPGLVAGIVDQSQQLDAYVLPNEAALYYVSDNTKINRAPGTGTGFSTATTLTELGGVGLAIFPAVSPDELTIYWGTNRGADGGAISFDIWTASRTSAANPFSGLQAVTELNSASNDIPSFLSADQCTLYLQSDRPGGVGGYDVYVATKPEN